MQDTGKKCSNILNIHNGFFIPYFVFSHLNTSCFFVWLFVCVTKIYAFCFFSLDDKRVRKVMSTEASESVSTDSMQCVLHISNSDTNCYISLPQEEENKATQLRYIEN